MQGVATQRGVVLSELQFFSLELFVARGGVAGRRFPLLPGFGTFDGYDFAGHKLTLSPWVFPPPLLLQAFDRLVLCPGARRYRLVFRQQEAVCFRHRCGYLHLEQRRALLLPADPRALFRVVYVLFP